MKTADIISVGNRKDFETFCQIPGDNASKMRLNFKVIFLSLIFGLIAWISQEAINYFLTPGKTINELLSGKLSREELATRSITILLFLLFGFLMSITIESRKKMKLKMREKEEEFSKVLELSKIPIIIIDARSCIRYWNDASEYIFRYLRKEVLGKDFKLFLSPQSHEIFDEKINIQKKSPPGFKGSSAFQVCGIRKDEKEIPLEISISSGKIKEKWLAICFLRDQTKEELMEKEFLLKNKAFESSFHSISILEKDERIFFSNYAFCKLWGFSPEEILSKRFPFLFQKEENCHHFLDKIQEINSFSDNLVAKRKDGSLFYAQLSGSKILDENKNNLGFLIYAADITQRIDVEAQQRVKNKFEQLITTISANFIGLSSDRIDKEIDISLEKIAETTESDRCSLYLYSSGKKQVYLAYEWPAHYQNLQVSSPVYFDAERIKNHLERINNRETIHISNISEFKEKNELLLKDFQWRDVRSFIHVPIAFGQEVLGFLSLESIGKEKSWQVEIVALLRLLGEIFASTIKRKLIEDQLKKSIEEKEILLKEIHHRIKNNMQVISSLLNLQARRFKDEKILEMLKESQNRIRSMALIHEKLYQSPDLSSINISHYIQSLISHLLQTYNFDQNKIKINMEIEDTLVDINTAISCGLIINELVSNSIKHAFPKSYLQERKINPELRVMFRISDGGDYKLIVGDNGIGLPEEFDINKTSSLGLRLVHSLTQQMNGKVRIQRKNGANFFINFLPTGTKSKN